MKDEYKAIADKAYDRYGDNLTTPDTQTMVVVEEAGEFLKEYRRFVGRARTSGSYRKTIAELADVVIASYVWAAMFDGDLDAEVEIKLAAIAERGGL